MPSGGKRAGSGRKLGSLTRRTQAIALKAAAEGRTPLEVLLENMRHFQKVAHDAEAVIEAMNDDQMGTLGGTHEEQFKTLLAKVKQAAGLRVLANEAASAAANYIHPRLSAVEHSGKIETTKVIRAPAQATTVESWMNEHGKETLQ